MKKSFPLMWMFFAAWSLFAVPVNAVPHTYKFVWSRYTGWEFYGFMTKSGIMDKWNKKMGVNVVLEYMGDYNESVNQYTAGNYVGVAVTNMDVLNKPALGGVDSEVDAVGDFSDGNDGVVSKDKGVANLCDLKGRAVRMCLLTVSQFALSRGLEIHCPNVSEKDLSLFDIQEGDVEPLFLGGDVKNIVTWNPHLMTIRTAAGAKKLFDSSEIPGEILDLMVVRTDAPEAVKMALVGAWYETMAIMRENGKQASEAVKYMAYNAGATEAQFREQLRTTHMYYNPAEGAAFSQSEQLKKTMQYVRDFLFSHGQYGVGVPKDYVGVQFPDGSVLGNQDNVKLRFTDKYMKLAAEGKL